MRNVNNVTVKSISGDLSARFVNGAIHLSEVGGDIGLRTVNGDVTFGKGVVQSIYQWEERDFRLKPDSPALKLGFTPIDTPALEHLEILTGKGGDENVGAAVMAEIEAIRERDRSEEQKAELEALPARIETLEEEVGRLVEGLRAVL